METSEDSHSVTLAPYPPVDPVRLKCTTACNTCKRRKERCDGRSPCGRCVERGVRTECCYRDRRVQKRTIRRESREESIGEVSRKTVSSVNIASAHRPSESPGHTLAASTSSTCGPETSRLIQDQKGRYMFIGDSANLSFLQNIRRLVGESIGPCSFVNDPLRYLMVEASPEGQPNWLNVAAQQMPPQISLPEARALIKSYLFATNCVLDLYDERDLMDGLPSWVEGEGQLAGCSIASPMFYLVLAIGAQTSPEDKDELAAALFTHGRYLTAQCFMEDASVSTVQAYALITFYLLGACRRNAAFMYLGIAVRAAYAVGLHRKELAASFSPREFCTRERLWKVIRILDLFMSASLGRPPSTSETRDTEVEEGYSASTDLCAIFEKILTDVYSRRMVSTDVLSNIGAHHRRWSSRFFRGLAEDKIQPLDVLEGGLIPNIGLLHVKEAYYWTIMLLTRPFLTESITIHLKAAASSGRKTLEPCTAADSNRVLVHACVDSAIRTVELLDLLTGCAIVPKRLPFVNNSLFVSALVLGLAYFGDLYQVFPLRRYLKAAQVALAQFSQDPIAQRNASIVGLIREACDLYFEKRTAQAMDHQSFAVGSMFGQIHRLRSQGPTRAHSPRTPGREINSFSEMNNDADRAANQSRTEGDDADYPFAAFENNLDFTDMPCPVMSPRTLWFDSYNENTPLFSTISSAQTSAQPHWGSSWS